MRTADIRQRWLDYFASKDQLILAFYERNHADHLRILGDGLDGVCSANSLHSRFRKAKVLGLALLNQFLDRSCNVFDWNVGIDPVLIEEVDDLDPQPPQRAFDGLPDVGRLAVDQRQPRPAAGVAAEADAQVVADHTPRLTLTPPRFPTSNRSSSRSDAS